MQYRKFESLAQALDFFTINASRLPKEVGAKMTRENKQLWVHLYPTVGGRWKGSSRWVSIRVTTDDLSLLLDLYLKRFGIRLEQLDFEVDESILGFIVRMDNSEKADYAQSQAEGWNIDKERLIGRHFIRSIYRKGR